MSSHPAHVDTHPCNHCTSPQENHPDDAKKSLMTAVSAIEAKGFAAQCIAHVCESNEDDRCPWVQWVCSRVSGRPVPFVASWMPVQCDLPLAYAAGLELAYASTNLHGLMLQNAFESVYASTAEHSSAACPKATSLSTGITTLRDLHTSLLLMRDIKSNEEANFGLDDKEREVIRCV